MVEDAADPSAEDRRRPVGRRRRRAGIARTIAPWCPMIGSVRPSWFAYITADEGIRPVASDTRTPSATAPWIAAIVRSEIRKS